MRLSRVAAALALLLGTEGVARAVPPRVDFWPAAEDSSYRISVEQLEAVGGGRPSVDGQGVGQTFIAVDSPIARLDVKIGNMGDGRPGQISIYRWRGSHAETTATRALWSDGVDLSGADTIRLHSFWPSLEVEPGATYFVEFEASGRGPYRIAHSGDESDSYKEGALRWRGSWRKNDDLWFRVFTTASYRTRRSSSAVQTRAPLDTSASQLKSVPPPRRFPRITGRSYYNRVARYANAVRPSSLNSCGRKGDETALVEAFLYRASCEAGKCKEQHARWVRDLYLDFYFWRACAADATLAPVPDPREARCADVCESGKVGWNPTRRATTAYLWTRESDVYSDADRIRILAAFADLGRHIWTTREYGTHNRALQQATTFRVLSDLVPNAPEAEEWRRYSDRVWEELFEAGDTREDSTEYASVVWWPAVLEYLAVTGSEAEVFADPRFRAWVERAYQLMTPIGPAADLGNSVGFGRDVAGFVWLFEAAARHYREPRFRDAAQRAFRFHSGWVRDSQPASDALGQTIAALAWAHFAVDESVGVAPPAPRSEQLENSPLANSAHDWEAQTNAPVGQRFEFPDVPLVRLALRSRGGSAKSVEVTLWNWVSDAGTTRAGVPLFREVASVSADGRIEVFPFIDSEPRDALYLEARPVDGSLQLAGSKPDASRAPEITTLVDSALTEPGADLWFEVYSLAGLGSAVTERRWVSQRPRSELGPRPHHTFEFGSEQVPDKLVLRSGFAEDSLFAVLNLVHFFGHGEAEQGAVVSIVDGGSLLLQDGPTPYWEHQRQRQNESRPIVQRFSGGTLTAGFSPTEVEHFRDARAATVARIAYNEPKGWGARVERRVFFVKDRFMLLRDCFSALQPMDAHFGTLWHPTDLGNVHAGNWFDAFARSPTANVFRIRNRPRRLLTYFVPRENVMTEAFVEDTYLRGAECNASRNSDVVPGHCRAGPPYVLSHSTNGRLGPDARSCIDSLLVPHAVSESAAELAQQVEVLKADDDTLALELQLGRERWLLIDDRSGSAINLPGLNAQLGYAIAREEVGVAPYYFASEARRLKWGNVDRSWNVPVSVEVGAREGRRSSSGVD